VVEFEAESISHLVCNRKGIEQTSDAYLSGYLETDKEVPKISFDRVMKVAKLIEHI
jgi:hypothetical protein